MSNIKYRRIGQAGGPKWVKSENGLELTMKIVLGRVYKENDGEGYVSQVGFDSKGRRATVKRTNAEQIDAIKNVEKAYNKHRLGKELVIASQAGTTYREIATAKRKKG